MVLREKIYTVTDLAELAALPENRDKKFELIEGVIFEVTTGTPAHGYVILRAARRLLDFAETHQLGEVFTDTVTYELSPEDEFVPDVSFISKERAPSLPPKRYFIAPDLVVEVLSPSNTLSEILHKVQRYIYFGTKVVWLIYPDEGLAYIVRRGMEPRFEVEIVEYGGSLEADDVLPGFSLPLATILPREE